MKLKNTFQKKKFFKTIFALHIIIVVFCGCGTSEPADNEIINSEQESIVTEEESSKVDLEESTQIEEEAESHVHKYSESITTQATCVETGRKTFICECGDTYTEEIKATGHKFDTYISNNDATYTSDGTETATCICGAKDTKIISNSKLVYTYVDKDVIMYAQKSVNVRDYPSSDGKKIGSLNKNDEVKVTGQCVETGWYRIKYEGSIAYVSDKYLGNKKVEEETKIPENLEFQPVNRTEIRYAKETVEIKESPDVDAKTIAILKPYEEFQIIGVYWGENEQGLENRYWYEIQYGDIKGCVQEEKQNQDLWSISRGGYGENISQIGVPVEEEELQDIDALRRVIDEHAKEQESWQDWKYEYGSMYWIWTIDESLEKGGYWKEQYIGWTGNTVSIEELSPYLKEHLYDWSPEGFRNYCDDAPVEGQIYIPMSREWNPNIGDYQWDFIFTYVYLDGGVLKR